MWIGRNQLDDNTFWYCKISLVKSGDVAELVSTLFVRPEVHGSNLSAVSVYGIFFVLQDIDPLMFRQFTSDLTLGTAQC
jgi:hypothetical protein